ncbi:MAG: hypothetical protein JNL01_04730 [Bdellovibrionales bacterium]|nr:hypothetical protein [Bdellovibrionales bacterium]
MSASKEDLTQTQANGEKAGEKMIRINGFEQVLAMLQAADPEFRNSLLRRILARDEKLGSALLQSLRDT